MFAPEGLVVANLPERQFVVATGMWAATKIAVNEVHARMQIAATHGWHRGTTCDCCMHACRWSYWREAPMTFT